MKSKNMCSKKYLSYESLFLILAIFFTIIFVSSCSASSDNKIDVNEVDYNSELIDTSSENEKTLDSAEQSSEQKNNEKLEEDLDVNEYSETKESYNQNNKDNIGTVTIKVYYTSEDGQYLVGEDRIISDSQKYLAAFLELLKPPISPGLIRLVPETTKVKKITLDKGNITLDLSQEFVEDRFKSDTVDVLLIYSIVNTFTGFNEINTVTFLVDGEKIETIGQLDISGPIYRDEGYIKKD